MKATEYYQDMKASRKGFVAGIRIMEHNRPQEDEPMSAYVGRI